MSDPVEDSNPETVQSSARRIATNGDVSGSDPKSEALGAEALILTNALRVDPPLDEIVPDDIVKAENIRPIKSPENSKTTEKRPKETQSASKHVIGRKSTASLKARSSIAPDGKIRVDDKPPVSVEPTGSLPKKAPEPVPEKAPKPEPLEITDNTHAGSSKSRGMRIKRPANDAIPADSDIPEVKIEDPEQNVFDEETLRDMVAEIVKEELTGALGERVTRNIRKLVRREIHRAMISQDMD